jgi:hypothetical protein
LLLLSLTRAAAGGQGARAMRAGSQSEPSSPLPPSRWTGCGLDPVCLGAAGGQGGRAGRAGAQGVGGGAVGQGAGRGQPHMLSMAVNCYKLQSAYLSQEAGGGLVPERLFATAAVAALVAGQASDQLNPARAYKTCYYFKQFFYRFASSFFLLKGSTKQVICDGGLVFQTQFYARLFRTNSSTLFKPFVYAH